MYNSDAFPELTTRPSHLCCYFSILGPESLFMFSEVVVHGFESCLFVVWDQFIGFIRKDLTIGVNQNKTVGVVSKCLPST